MESHSIAASYYAVPRMTRDIDLVVELSAAVADRLCALFEADFYIDRAAVRDAIAARGAFNMIHHAHVLDMGLIVRKGSDWVRESRSEVQLADIGNLLACADLDRDYLSRWVARLGLDSLYQEVAG